jgi:hypothetical protein
VTAPADPLADWDTCDVPACPLVDPDAPEPDDIDDMLDTGMAHGVQHVQVGDVWLVPAVGDRRNP